MDERRAVSLLYGLTITVDFTKEEYEALNLAADALQKNMPMAPIAIPLGTSYSFRCPACGVYIDRSLSGESWCYQCGQHIKWRNIHT